MTTNLLTTGVAGLPQRFKDALAFGGTIDAHVEIIDPNGNVIASTDESSSPRLIVDDGTVNVSGATAITRDWDATIIDPTGDLRPDEASDMLHPLSGNEIRLYRGFVYDDGDADLVLLITGVNVSAPTTWRNDQGLHISLTGLDRAYRVRRRRLVQPWSVPAGANYVDEIVRLITNRYPQAQFRAVPRRHVTPALIIDEQEDPWEHAVNMAGSIGYRLYADVDGVFVLEPQPDTTSADVSASWTYADGPRSTTLGIEVHRTSEGVYSGVIATGEHPSLDVPVRGVAWDTNPNSPTYHLGTFGEVPYFMTSQYIATTEQAQDAATGNLQRVIGLSEQVTLEGLVNPAHRPADVLAIEHERAGVGAAYVLDAFDVPLRGATTSYETRERFLG